MSSFGGGSAPSSGFGSNSSSSSGFGGTYSSSSGFGGTTGSGGGFGSNSGGGGFGSGTGGSSLFGSSSNNGGGFGTGGGFKQNNSGFNFGGGYSTATPKSVLKPNFSTPVYKSSPTSYNSDDHRSPSTRNFKPKMDSNDNLHYYSITAYEESAHSSFEELAYEEYVKEHGKFVSNVENKKPTTSKPFKKDEDDDFILQHYFIQTKEKIYCDFCNEEDASNYCNQCKKSSCQECLEFIHRKGEKKHHMEKDITKLANLTLRCHLHKKDLVAFCVDCHEFTCLSCVLQNGIHSNHKVISIDEADTEIKELTEKNLKKIKPIAELLKKRNDELNNQQKRIHKIVDFFFDSQIDLIEKMESQIETISKTETSEATNFPVCIQLMRMVAEKDKTIHMDYRVLKSMIEESFEKTNEKNSNFIIHCKDCLGKPNEKCCLKCYLKDHSTHEMFYISYDDAVCCTEKINTKLQEVTIEDEKKEEKKTITFGSPSKNKEKNTGFVFGGVENSEEKKTGFSFGSTTDQTSDNQTSSLNPFKTLSPNGWSIKSQDSSGFGSSSSSRDTGGFGSSGFGSSSSSGFGSSSSTSGGFGLSSGTSGGFGSSSGFGSGSLSTSGFGSLSNNTSGFGSGSTTSFGIKNVSSGFGFSSTKVSNSNSGFGFSTKKSESPELTFSPTKESDNDEKQLDDSSKPQIIELQDDTN